MDGILLINKPDKMTSRDAVNKVSHYLGIKKIGHTGTLDPIATGLLVLCIGKATKLVDLITNNNKEYIAEVTLGIETDTLDTEGKIIREESVGNITEEQIEVILNSFLGESKQEVPKYSAVKIKGRKLYEYARNNIDIELPVRDIVINSIELIGNIDKRDNKIIFKFKCNVSKGTYIRSLIKDIGSKLGIPACMSALQRTKQGIFNLEDSYKLENIENDNYKILDIKEVLSELNIVKADKDMEPKIRNGAILDRFFDGEMAVIMDMNDNIIAIYQTYVKDSKKVKPYKMFI